MKKNRTRDKFIKSLREGNNVSTACKTFDISRQTIYRWRREDKEFDLEMNEALDEGDQFMNDFAENQLKQKIKEGDIRANIYYLSSRHPKYIDKRHESRGDIQKIIEENKQMKFQLKMMEPVPPDFIPLSVQKRMLEADIKKAQLQIEDIDIKLEPPRITEPIINGYPRSTYNLLLKLQ